MSESRERTFLEEVRKDMNFIASKDVLGGEANAYLRGLVFEIDEFLEGRQDHLS